MKDFRSPPSKCTGEFWLVLFGPSARPKMLAKFLLAFFCWCVDGYLLYAYTCVQHLFCATLFACLPLCCICRQAWANFSSSFEYFPNVSFSAQAVLVVFGGSVQARKK